MIRFVRRHQLFLIAALAGLAGLLLYWPALRLPLVYDTLLHIRIAEGLDLAKTGEGQEEKAEEVAFLAR